MKKFLTGSILLLVLVLNIFGNQSIKEVNAQSEKNNISVEEKGESKVKIQTDESEVCTLEELNELVSQEIDTRAAILKEKYEKLQTEIDTYDTYIANKEKIADYYASVYRDMQDTCICMREYCVKYAQLIFESEKTNGEKYDDLEEMYDIIYDDAGEEIYDEFYEGVLEDTYDVYYDGILEDAYDTVPYEEWSEARLEEYDRWSDTRSDIYETWSDFRSEVYDFWSDLRREFWEDDQDRVKEKIQDFQNDTLQLREDIDKKEKLLEQPENFSEADGQKDDSQANAGEMRPEFKEAMDRYEGFYDKYCEFMKKYNANPTDLELLSAYSDMMAEMVEMTEKFEAWEENELNTEELNYYIEVNNRIAQKIIGIMS